MPPRRTRRRTSAISAVPRNGANVTGPPDGIMDVGTAFFVPEAWRQGQPVQRPRRLRARPGTGPSLRQPVPDDVVHDEQRHPAGVHGPVLDTTHFGNVNYTHTFSSNKLNEFRGGFMRLVGEPHTQLQPLEVPGINITGATGFGTASYPRGWWQTNWHFKNIFTWSPFDPPVEDGRRAAADVRLRGEHHDYIPAYNFSSILNFANDQALQMTRYVDPRTRRAGDGVLGADADGVGHLHQRRLEGAPQRHDQRRSPVRELRDLQGQRRHAAQHRVRSRLDVRGTAGLRARRFRRPVLPDRQQQRRAAARVRVGPDGDGAGCPCAAATVSRSTAS